MCFSLLNNSFFLATCLPSFLTFLVSNFGFQSYFNPINTHTFRPQPLKILCGSSKDEIIEPREHKARSKKGQYLNMKEFELNTPHLPIYQIPRDCFLYYSRKFWEATVNVYIEFEVKQIWVWIQIPNHSIILILSFLTIKCEQPLRVLLCHEDLGESI